MFPRDDMSVIMYDQWFKGGTNICYNCLDKNVEIGLGDKIAMYWDWEGNEIGVDASLTYSEFLQQLANYLKDVGVKKGDAVVIYLPMLMELPIAMRLHVHGSGLFIRSFLLDFSADSLAQRIIDCKPKVILTCNAVKRGPKTINLKAIVDAALDLSSKDGVSVDVCMTYENSSATTREITKWQSGRDVWWQDVIPKYPTSCEVVWVDAEDPLFLLYTSGSTGKPKGVVHTTGGYMIYTATTFKYAFDYKSTDVYWCTADCGWITGHRYVTYGPMLNGATVVVFEGAPNYPDSERCWENC